MNKIICDICGTTYQESAECCPICGCSRAAAAEFLGVDLPEKETVETAKPVAGAFIAKNKKKEIFDFDEVNSEDIDEEEEEDEEDYDEEEEEEETPRSNTFVVILLTVLIIALLVGAGFIFFRYFLPNMKSEETVPTAATEAVEEAPVMTTELTIPCDQIFMTNASVAELNAEGQQFLLHIKTIPEDTTDRIVYTSANEAIATVTEDGKITAISEGETVVSITCGEYYIDCPVIVKYIEETVPPTTEAIVEETAAPETVETAPAQNDVTLKLKKTDILLGVYYEFQLELDCDLKPEDVTWSSEHPHIAKVDEEGNVTALKEGTTSIKAKYGDQEAECIVRCGWY